MENDSAVIVIDMLYDFIYGALKCKRALKIIDPIKKLLDDARKSNCPVIYACDMHEKDDPELKIWGEHAMKGTPGDVIIDELSPKPSDLIIEKHTYSCFLNTNLNRFLKEKGIETLYIVGIQAHICVQHAAYDAYVNGYNIIVPSNCTEAFTKDLYQHALEYISSMYGANTKPY